MNTDGMTMKIVTPQDVRMIQNVSAVYCQTTGGDLGVLRNHAPMMACLKPGTLRWVEDGQEKTAETGEGVLQVEKNYLTLLLRSCRETPVA